MKKNFNDKRIEDCNHWEIGLNNYVQKCNQSKSKKGLQGFHGDFYHVHLATLFLIRALDMHLPFKLDAEVQDAEKFDDLMLEIDTSFPSSNTNKTKEYLLIQIKHRNDESKKINFDNILTETNGDYSLVKYFNSYIKCKAKSFFNDGTIKNVVLYTNLNLDLDDKYESIVMRNVINDITREDSIFNMTNKNLRKTPASYRFNDGMISLLEPKLNPYKKLAERLIGCIVKKQTIKDHESIFRSYHGVLAKEVLDLTSKVKKFHENFVNNNCALDETKKFREIMIIVIKEQTDYLSLEELQDAICQKNITIITSKKFGEADNKNWQSPCTSNDVISKENIQDFFEHLIFAVNQPNEVELGELVKYEICKKFDFTGANIYNDFHTRMINWLKNEGDTFLTHDIANQMFEMSEKTAKLESRKEQYMSTIQKLNIQFNINKQEKSELEEFLLTKDKILVIKTPDATLSIIKIIQILKEINLPNIHFTCIEVTIIANYYEVLKEEFELHIDLLIFDCKSVSNENNLNIFCNRLLEIVKSIEDKKIIFVTQKNHSFVSELLTTISDIPYKICADDNIGLVNLSNDCQRKILTSAKINFQGQKVNLDSFIENDTLKHFIGPEILFEILQYKEIVIGKSLYNLCDLQKFYINRRLERRTIIKNHIENEKSLFFFLNNFENFDDSKLKERHDIIIISQFNENFERLKEKYYQRNVHHIRRENNKLIWQQSHGSLEKLREYVDNSLPYESVKVEDINDKIVIISSEAGTGKSTLINKLVQKIKESNPTLCVVKINLLDYTSKFKKWNVTSNSQSERESVDICYKALIFEAFKSYNNKQKINETLFQLLCSKNTLDMFSEKYNISPLDFLEIKIFNYFFDRRKITFCFDGFDEIAPHYVKTVLNLLKTFTVQKVQRMWVTTRPYNFYNQLENSLNTFAYTLQPFSHEERNKMFVHFLPRETLLPMMQNTNITPDFFNIPLHIKMVVDILKSNFPQSKDHKFEVLNITTLYEYFIKIKFQIRYREIFPETKNSTPDALDLIEKYEKDLLKSHQKLALFALFDDELLQSILSNDDIKEIPVLLKNIKEGTEKTGFVISVTDDKPRFIHQTFAEFFISKLFWEKFKETDYKSFKANFIKHYLIGCMIKDCRSGVAKFVQLEAIRDLQNSIDFLHKDDKIWLFIETLFIETNFPVEYIIYDTNYEYLKKIFNPYHHMENEAQNLEDTQNSLNSNELIEKKMQFQKRYSQKMNFLVGHIIFKYDSTLERQHLQKIKGCRSVSILWNIVEHFLSMTTSKEQKLRFAKILKFMGANCRIQLLFLCVEYRYAEIIHSLTRIIHKRFFKANLQNGTWQVNPLWLALSKGDLEISKLLIEGKIYIPNWKDTYGRNLFDTMFYYKAFDVIESSLKLNISNFDMIMYFAVEMKEFFFLAWALNKNLISLDSAEPATAFIFHILSKNEEKVKHYVEIKKIDSSARNIYGETCSHYAAVSDLKIIKYLVEKNYTDFDTQNKKGETPLFYAIKFNILVNLKYLLEVQNVDCKIKDNNGQSAIHLAAEKGKFDIVKYFIEVQNFDCNIRDAKENTILHLAAFSGSLDIIKYLVEYNVVDFNVVNNDRLTGVHMAAKRGKLDIVKYLIEKQNFNYNIRDAEGNTILHLAAFSGSLGIIKYLIEQKKIDFNVINKCGRTVVHLATVYGEFKVVKYFIEEQNFDCNIRDAEGNTILHLAAFSGSLEIIKYLIEHKKIDFNDVNKRGRTVVHLATVHRKFNVVKYFIEEQNFDCNIKDADRNTILHIATLFGSLDIIKLLGEHKKIYFEVLNKYGLTAAHMAAEDGQLDIVKYFIEEQNFDCNIRDAVGNTILHSAAFFESLEIIKYLVEDEKIDFNVVNKLGRTVVHLATAYREFNVVKYFIEEQNFDCNIKDADGNTILLLAALYGSLDIIKLLGKHKKIDFKVVNKSGQTAAHAAAEERKLDIVKYFIEEHNFDYNIESEGGITMSNLEAPVAPSESKHIS